MRTTDSGHDQAWDGEAPGDGSVTGPRDPRVRSRPYALAFGIVLLATGAWALTPAPAFELIYTAPVETTLARPGLRSPVAAWTEIFDRAKKSLDIEQFYVAW